MKINHLFPLLLLLQCSTLSQAQKQEETTLVVTGLTQKTLLLTTDSLRKRSVQEGKNIRIASSKGQIIGTISHFKGIKLKDLLDEVQIVIPEYNDRGLYYIKVTSHNEMKVIFSWHELYSSITGEKTFIIYESDSTSPQEKGTMNVVCSSDTFTECRYIKKVKSIEVLRAF